MNFDDLRSLAAEYEVRIDSHDGFISEPPFEYDSLRHAFGAYFNTFHTLNHWYDEYVMGPKRDQSYQRQFLDEENTVQSIVLFERFFELFVKRVLERMDSRLNYTYKGQSRNEKLTNLFLKIDSDTFVPNTFDDKPLTTSFRQALTRLYQFFELQRNGHVHSFMEAAKPILTQYGFLDNPDHQASLQLLNWYRDRILHKGNVLPSLWFLDYFVTQRLLPIVREILSVDKSILNNSMFYLATETDINILESLCAIKFSIKNFVRIQSFEDIPEALLRIGHLKELGRASLNMNLFMRRNLQAGCEYNYTDPKGRGKRFAKIELEIHDHAVKVTPCPCCAVESMVLYQQEIDPSFGRGKYIYWVTCYTCHYHVRYNTGDPYHLGLSKTRIFPEAGE